MFESFEVDRAAGAPGATGCLSASARFCCATQTDNGGNAVAEKRADFTYNALRQFDTITRYASLDTSEKVAASEYGYDALARLTDLEHLDPQQSALATYEWTFDTLNRVTQFVSDDGTVDYNYDATHQLIAADSDYDTDEQYVYDLNGNRQLATNDAGTNQGYETGANNTLLFDGTYTYEYDAEGNRTARFVDNDSDGIVSSGDTDITEYTWDHRNRLTGVVNRDTYGGAATQAVDYFYDVFDRRISRTLDADGDGAGDAVRESFIWDGRNSAL